jgi:hypothetical protein
MFFFWFGPRAQEIAHPRSPSFSFIVHCYSYVKEDNSNTLPADLRVYAPWNIQDHRILRTLLYAR